MKPAASKNFSIEEFRKALLQWYWQRRRELPWRKTKNPYAILVSELMLQQTQVKTVIPYYKKFLKLFPSAKALAKAPEEKVLAAWAGLGYYRRARYLQAAAKKVVSAGGFPSKLEEIQKLPGVGSYTAAAVGSIAFGLPAAVVDGNVIRVLSRLFLMEGDPSRGEVKSAIWKRAGELLDEAHAGDFNQAMMELGATVCSPAAPSCLLCPVAAYCKAHQQERWAEFPQLPQRKAAVKVEKAVAMIVGGRGETKIVMAPRTGSGREGDGGRMLGFWHFPEIVLENAGPRPEDLAKSFGKKILGTSSLELKGSLREVQHTVLHYRIQLKPLWLKTSKLAAKKPWAFVPLEKAKKLPLASAEKQLFERLYEAKEKQKFLLI